MNLALEVTRLKKEYDTFTLKDVSFSLPKGSIMGFIGENGAGKTTTIDLILNLRTRDGGEVKIFQKDNIQEEKAIKRDIGIVLDESRFHDNLMPGDINKIMKHIYPTWQEDSFSGYCKRFGLPMNQTVKKMSKGMGMKLSIAAALSHSPKLLILDEATSGLDPVVRNEILDIFLEYIQNEENSILLSSHITSDLERVADYITFIHDGAIVFSEEKDVLMEECGVLHTSRTDAALVQAADILGRREHQFGVDLLIRGPQRLQHKYRDMTIDPVSLEDIMVFYQRGNAS
ncbi:ABC transporter ATP-binding protein [Eubacteriales bacterium OttesenSCG-928-M02]|nr:ABC transporter ATP-binding protein [Eubacteriales bacterium OttesenSCG-928-M02]